MTDDALRIALDKASEYHRDDDVTGALETLAPAADYLIEHSGAAYSRAAMSADIFRLMGVLHVRRTQFARAIEWFEKARDLAEEAGDTSRLGRIIANLGIACDYTADYAQALTYYSQALDMLADTDDAQGRASIESNIGIVYHAIADHNLALHHINRSLELYEQGANNAGIARAHGNLGNVYASLEQYDRALQHYNTAVDMHRRAGRKESLARAISNTSGVYRQIGEIPKATELLREALAIHEEIQNPTGIAITLGNIGGALFVGGNTADAKEYLEKALEKHTSLGLPAERASVLADLAAIHLHRGSEYHDTRRAEELLTRALQEAQTLGTRQIMCDIHKTLADLYEQQGRWADFATHLRLHYEVKSSILDERVRLHAERVALERNLNDMRRAGERADERAKATEAILKTVVPAPIAERMLRNDTASEHFPQASVLFADIVNFTSLAAQLPHQELMYLLNAVFSRFDSIIAERGCQRIKTIGDGYLATAGLPIPKADHAEALALAAVEMIEPQTIYINRQPDGDAVEVHFRIGLHAGPVTAGLVGGSLTQYDIYGDTVNTASRMESHGKADTVLCTAAFAALVEHCRDIYIENQGVINLKGMGPMATARLSKKMRQGPSGTV